MSDRPLEGTNYRYMNEFCMKKDCSSFKLLDEPTKKLLVEGAKQRLKLKKGNLDVCYMVIICYYLKDLSDDRRRGPRAIALLLSKLEDLPGDEYTVETTNGLVGQLGKRDREYYLTLFPTSANAGPEVAFNSEDRIDMIVAVFEHFNKNIQDRVRVITNTKTGQLVFHDLHGLIPDRPMNDSEKKCVDCLDKLAKSIDLESESEDCKVRVIEQNCTKDYQLKPPSIDCVICMEKIVGQDYTARCGHRFHKECLDNAIRAQPFRPTGPVCPVCRQSLEVAVPEVLEVKVQRAQGNLALSGAMGAMGAMGAHMAIIFIILDEFSRAANNTDYDRVTGMTIPGLVTHILPTPEAIVDNNTIQLKFLSDLHHAILWYHYRHQLPLLVDRYRSDSSINQRRRALQEILSTMHNAVARLNPDVRARMRHNSSVGLLLGPIDLPEANTQLDIIDRGFINTPRAYYPGQPRSFCTLENIARFLLEAYSREHVIQEEKKSISGSLSPGILGYHLNLPRYKYVFEENKEDRDRGLFSEATQSEVLADLSDALAWYREFWRMPPDYGYVPSSSIATRRRELDRQLRAISNDILDRMPSLLVPSAFDEVGFLNPTSDYSIGNRVRVSENKVENKDENKLDTIPVGMVSRDSLEENVARYLLAMYSQAMRGTLVTVPSDKLSAAVIGYHLNPSKYSEIGEQYDSYIDKNIFSKQTQSIVLNDLHKALVWFRQNQRISIDQDDYKSTDPISTRRSELRRQVIIISPEMARRYPRIGADNPRGPGTLLSPSRDTDFQDETKNIDYLDPVSGHRTTDPEYAGINFLEAAAIILLRNLPRSRIGNVLDITRTGYPGAVLAYIINPERYDGRVDLGDIIRTTNDFQREHQEIMQLLFYAISEYRLIHRLPELQARYQPLDTNPERANIKSHLMKTLATMADEYPLIRHLLNGDSGPGTAFAPLTHRYPRAAIPQQEIPRQVAPQNRVAYYAMNENKNDPQAVVARAFILASRPNNPRVQRVVPDLHGVDLHAALMYVQDVADYGMTDEQIFTTPEAAKRMTIPKLRGLAALYGLNIGRGAVRKRDIIRAIEMKIGWRWPSSVPQGRT
jgi:hypothetical protein